MHNWRQTIEVFPDLANVESWPTIDPSALPDRKRATFLQRREAVRLVLSGNSVKSAAQATGLSPASISKVLNRCLAQNPSQQNLPLSRGLVPGVQVRETKKTIQGSNKNSGYRGYFQATLQEYPDIENALRKDIKASMSRRRDSLNVTSKSLHASFLQQLRKKGLDSNDYPFCTDDQAKESIRRWHRQVSAEIAAARSPLNKRVPNAGAMLGHPHPLQIVEMDHHLVDAESSLHLYLEASAFQVARRVPRFWLGLAIDYQTTAIIGGAFELAGQPSQDSVLSCLGQVESGLQTDQLLANLIELPEEPVLPQDVDSELALLPHIVKLDNAWAHFATHVRTIVLDRWYSTLCYGVPGIPLARQVVESAFRKLEAQIHRLPSTSGTSMLDPNRETRANRRRIPVITVQALLRVILDLIKEHNFTPAESLGNLSPVEALQRRVSRGAMLHKLGCHTKTQPGLFEREITRPVKYEKPFRTYVNFAYVKYTGKDLTVSHKGQSVIIRYDIRDVRTVGAYTAEHEFIGTLYAPARWQQHPHSLRTRKRICTKKRALAVTNDPLRAHFEALLENTESSKAPRDIVRLISEGYGSLVSKTAIGIPASAKHPDSNDSKVIWRVKK